MSHSLPLASSRLTVRHWLLLTAPLASGAAQLPPALALCSAASRFEACVAASFPTTTRAGMSRPRTDILFRLFTQERVRSRAWSREEMLTGHHLSENVMHSHHT